LPGTSELLREKLPGEKKKLEFLGQALERLLQVRVPVVALVRIRTSEKLGIRLKEDSFKSGSNGTYFVEKRFRLKEVRPLFSFNCE
jgi:hypothetical protein